MKKFYSLFLLFFAGSILATAVDAGQKLSLDINAMKKLVKLEQTVKGMAKKAPASRADDAEQWKLIGTGKYTDDVMTSAFMDSEIWEVQIYESETTPGFYRVENPYGNGNCPYFDETFDCCDFLLHAENPDAVWIEYVELKDIDFGMAPEGEYCPAYLCDYAGYYIAAGYFTPEQAVAMGMASGKLLGGNITFEAESLILDFPLFGDGIQMPANLSGLFCVSLPGAKDYSFSIETGDICTDSELSFAYKAGADVATVKYDIFEGMLSFEDKDEELFADVVTDGKTAADGLVTVAPEYGINTLAVVAMTGEGEVVGKEIIYCFGQQENTEEWKNIGKAEYSGRCACKHHGPTM